MKEPKYYLYLTETKHRLLLQALNKLQHESRYTDAVDEVIIKVAKTKKKKIRIA